MDRTDMEPLAVKLGPGMRGFLCLPVAGLDPTSMALPSATPDQGYAEVPQPEAVTFVMSEEEDVEDDDILDDEEGDEDEDDDDDDDFLEDDEDEDDEEFFDDDDDDDELVDDDDEV